MWYGGSWSSNDKALASLIEGTKALGKVLSTPVGVVLLEELELVRWSGQSARADYQAMIDEGKRPTKKREDARAKYESYEGEYYANMNALVYMVVEASGYTVSHVAARRTINYELEELEEVSTFDPSRENLRKLRRRCCDLVYGY